MVDAEPNEMFLGLISSLQFSAWMQLGKVMNPPTGKSERDLEHAKETIDLLGVLEEKTRGNLHPDEAKLLGRILFDLRMNYVEEASAPPSAAAAPAEAPAPGPGGEAAGAPEPPA